MFVQKQNGFRGPQVVFHKPESGPKAPLKAANFDQAGKYIFGFHPHGLYPTGVSQTAHTHTHRVAHNTHT